jgi:hypothetical protein
MGNNEEIVSNEIDIYLAWLAENNIESTEKSIISFVMLRGGLHSGRHLFEIWRKHSIYQSSSGDVYDQVRRFFINPTDSHFFVDKQKNWFYFFVDAYTRKDSVSSEAPKSPQFSYPGL